MTNDYISGAAGQIGLIFKLSPAPAPDGMARTPKSDTKTRFLGLLSDFRRFLKLSYLGAKHIFTQSVRKCKNCRNYCGMHGRNWQ